MENKCASPVLNKKERNPIVISPSTPGGAILIAEDNPDDAYLIKRAVRKLLPNPIHLAKDGYEAIAYVRGDGELQDRARFPYPDLLLLDLRMPNLDGFEVLRWLQSMKRTHSVLTVVLSATREMRELSDAYKLGANSFLPKPISSAELKVTLEAWSFQSKGKIKNA